MKIVLIILAGISLLLGAPARAAEENSGKTVAPVIVPSTQLHNAGAAANAWWSDRRAGWIGGIGGSALGLLGALIGTLAGRGRARQLVLGLLVAMLAIGGISLVLGIVALVMRQPYGVYYPLLLCGLLATLLPLMLIPQVKRRYEQLELRRMSALDATT